MEEFNESNYRNTELLEKRFNSYMKDLPLTPEDLRNPLLDVGTGKGDFIKYLREVLGNKSAIGVERSASRIDENYEGLIVGDGMNLPFDDESFDTVVSHNYLPMFVSDPATMQAAIEEQLRVVKEGGKIMGDIHTPESVTACDAEARRNLGTDYSKRDEEISREQYEGAENLQQYLKGLNPREYKVEFVGSSDKTVVVITKLGRPERNHTRVLSEKEKKEIRQERLSNCLDMMDVQSIEKGIQENPEETKKILDESFEKLLNILETLFKKNQRKLATFIAIIYENNLLPSLVEQTNGLNLDLCYERLISSLKNKAIDKEEWLVFLNGYKKYLEEKNQWLTENYKHFIEDFIGEFDKKINPLLSNPISIERIKDVLNRNEIRILDILDLDSDGNHNFSGIISIGLFGLIAFDSSEEELDMAFKQTFNHEALHAITAGQSIERISLESKEKDEDGNISIHFGIHGDNEWSGLQLRAFNETKFLWLNEAITETLAAISTEGEPAAYLEEIKLFNLVCEKGKINPQLFYDAYFEKKGRVRDKNSDRNFWNELMKRLDEAFPVGTKKFLVRLDDVVREQGIEKAIDFILNEEWKKR